MIDPSFLDARACRKKHATLLVSINIFNYLSKDNSGAMVLMHFGGLPVQGLMFQSKYMVFTCLRYPKGAFGGRKRWKNIVQNYLFFVVRQT